MPETEVRKLLGELEKNINTMEDGNESARQRLSQLSSAVEAHLNTNEKVETDLLMEDLVSAIEEFESEHPNATALLNNIATTLSSMGI